MRDASPASVVPLLLAGKTISEVAQALAADENAIRQRLHRARAIGLIKPDFKIASRVPRLPRKGVRPSLACRQSRGEFVVGGGIVQMVAGLPEGIQDWLIDSIPEGATLTDLLRAIITDAYNEEHP